MILPLNVLDEIHRYLTDYAWEWRTICKVINYKHGYHFEPNRMARIYKESIENICEGPKKRK